MNCNNIANKDFKSDFFYFWDKIENNENFVFSRYADGEVLLMNGQSVGYNTQAFSSDKWYALEGLSKVGKQLLKTLNHNEDNYYYAISSKSDNINDYNYLINNIKQDSLKITFVNLWINSNYHLMLDKLNNMKRDVILICNKNAKKENFPFNIIDVTEFPDDCINFWESNDSNFINSLIEKYSLLKNKLFFISCGPISEIIIHELYKNNPNNAYIDVGSSIDEFVHGYKTRPYMSPSSEYSKAISFF
jgi:hypothetical protein